MGLNGEALDIFKSVGFVHQISTEKVKYFKKISFSSSTQLKKTISDRPRTDPNLLGPGPV